MARDTTLSNRVYDFYRPSDIGNNTRMVTSNLYTMFINPSFLGIGINEVEFLTLNKISGISLNSEVLQRRDGGTGRVINFHSNNKDFGTLTMEAWREEDNKEYLKIRSFVDNFINFGIKVDGRIIKYSLNKTPLIEYKFNGLCFNGMSLKELDKTQGGLMVITFTAKVDMWYERPY